MRGVSTRLRGKVGVGGIDFSFGGIRASSPEEVMPMVSRTVSSGWVGRPQRTQARENLGKRGKGSSSVSLKGSEREIGKECCGKVSKGQITKGLEGFDQRFGLGMGYQRVMGNH